MQRHGKHPIFAGRHSFSIPLTAFFMTTIKKSLNMNANISIRLSRKTAHGLFPGVGMNIPMSGLSQKIGGKAMAY